MLILHEGELAIQEGRLMVDELAIEKNAIVRNESEIYTYTTVSEGEIVGKGTLWAHISSKAIGGVIAPLQTIIYYGIQTIKRRYIQLMSGSYIASTSTGHGDTE